MADTALPDERLRRQALGLLAGFAIQFLVGMALNLLVTVRYFRLGDVGSNFFSRSWHALTWSLSGGGSWELAFHVSLGLLLVLGTIGLVVSSALLRSRVWIVTSAAALIFTLGAFFNGLAFLDYHKDGNSMVMASAWLVAVGALVYACVSTAPSLKPQP